MPTLRRAFLLALAVTLMVVLFCLGTSFTYSAEPPERARGSELFWLLLAVVFASPLWLPAILSTRSPRAAIAVRWLSAAALLMPLRYAAAVAVHQFQFYPQPLFSVTIFAAAAMLSVGCVVAIVLLLRPSARVLDKSA